MKNERFLDTRPLTGDVEEVGNHNCERQPASHTNLDQDKNLISYLLSQTIPFLRVVIHIWPSVKIVKLSSKAF